MWRHRFFSGFAIPERDDVFLQSDFHEARIGPFRGALHLFQVVEAQTLHGTELGPDLRFRNARPGQKHDPKGHGSLLAKRALCRTVVQAVVQFGQPGIGGDCWQSEGEENQREEKR